MQLFTSLSKFPLLILLCKLFMVCILHGRIQREGGGDRGSGHKNIGFFLKYWSGSPENHNATMPAFNVGPIKAVFGSSIPHQLKKKLTKKKNLKFRPPLTKVPRSSYVLLRPWKGRGPSIPYPFIYCEKYHIPKINMANIPKIQKALYPHVPKIDPSIQYPFKYLQKYPVSLYVFGRYP